jgi:stage V sporulation protein SpoVS
MAVQTTFSMFQQLLRNSINNDSSLEATLKAALLLRVDYLARDEQHIMGASEVNAITGGTVDQATDSITFATGVGGDVTFDLITFGTPVTIDGTKTAIGLLLGNVGQGSNPAVAEADITIQYRTSTSGAWKAFGRNVVLDGISTIQFKATIAVQAADADMPKLHLVSEQD